MQKLWSVIKEANLSRVEFSSFSDSWNDVAEMIKTHGADDYIHQWNMFKNTVLYSPANCRLVRAGKKFYNIIWDGRHIGSVVSTNSKPLRIFLRSSFSSITEHLSEDLLNFIEDAELYTHYGTGKTRIKFEEFKDNHEFSVIFNEIYSQNIRCLKK
jgi:hypothetical protein